MLRDHDCGPLLKSLNAYIAKADAELTDTLEDAGFAVADETVKEISAFERLVAACLKKDTMVVMDALKECDDLLVFAENYWQSIKMESTLAEELEVIFYDEIITCVMNLTVEYIAEVDPELAEASIITKNAEATISKSIGSDELHIEITQRTTYWAKTWSEGLAEVMQLNSHKQIEDLLTTSLEQGHSVTEFAKTIMDSGIRDEYYRARRVAQTELLTAHSAAQQESYIQTPAVKKKMWRHTGSHKNEPRPNHVAISGQTVPVDEPFELMGDDGGIYYPMYPRDPEELPAGERINCKCIMQSVTESLDMTLEERMEMQRQAIAEDDGKWEEELKAKRKAEGEANLREAEAKLSGQSFTNTTNSDIMNAPIGDSDNTGNDKKDLPKTTANSTVTPVNESDYAFSNGFRDRSTNAVIKDALIYETTDGTKIVYPANYNSAMQRIDPERAINIYNDLPDKLKEQIDSIEFVDYKNPQDSYWASRYKKKGFTSFATGGERSVTFWANDKVIDLSDSKILGVLHHETAHNWDEALGVNGVRFSKSREWQNIVNADYKVCKLKATTSYGATNMIENFADSVKSYLEFANDFSDQFPNRTSFFEGEF